MGVIADHTFKKGFLLDEEKLRKISKIISDRKRQIASDPLLTYKVYRASGFTYITEDVHVLLNEDNSEWNKIRRIIVRLEQDKKDTFELDFSQEDTRLHIEGEDRDAVNLLFNEMKQYLEHEVNILNSSIKRIAKCVTILFLSILGLFSFALAADIFVNYENASMHTAINSIDLSEKINFLIKKQHSIERNISILMIFMLMLHVAGPVTEQIEKLYPRRIFLIGKEIERHEKRKKLRENIFYFILSVIAGIVVYFITKYI